MADMPFGAVFVVLCDWRGKCIWASDGDLPIQVGELAWMQLPVKSQRESKLAFSQVVTLREERLLEVSDQQGALFRCWLWPLDCPETAACIMGLRLPRAIESLTARERRCLELLAKGTETKQIASKLDVSLSTVHTHLKHAREKLGLRSFETLVSFSARYFFPLNRRFDWQSDKS